MDEINKVILHTLLFVFVCHTHAGRVNIFGLDSENKIEQDFIAVLKHSPDIKNITHLQRLQSLETFTKDLSPTDDDNLVIGQKYSFGNFAALRVHITEDEITQLSQHYDVDFIQVNQKVRINQLDGPACAAQSTGSGLWGLSRINTHPKPSYTGAKYAYLQGDGEGVYAYVVDTGAMVDHEELKGRATFGFVSTSHQSEGKVDLNGHGTHVSGTIAGKTYGVAKQAQIIAVKVLGQDGSGTTADIIEGLQWVHDDFATKKAEKGKKAKGVVNMSLGGIPGQVGTADELAITELITNGLSFTIAAGNDNADACYVSPARLSTAVTVAAINISDVITDYSNFGPCVDVLAPADGIRSSYIGSTTATAILSGTSMGAPHVAGVIARYLSQLCDAPTPAAIKAWLQDTATHNLINLAGKPATSNKLIYMACMAEDGTSPNTQDYARSSILPNQSNSTFWILVGMVTILVVCLSGFLVSCVTLSKVNKVKEGQKHMLYTQLPRGYQAYSENSRLLT